MKIIGRILIILLAASVVVGAAWALTRNGANAQLGPDRGTSAKTAISTARDLPPAKARKGLIRASDRKDSGMADLMVAAGVVSFH